MGFYNYNEPLYNEHQYNADTNNVLNVLTDLLTPTEATIVKTIGALKVETVTGNDIRLNDAEQAFLDAIFPDDFLSKSITNKGLQDTIRFAVWFKIVRVSGTNNPWGD